MYKFTDRVNLPSELRFVTILVYTRTYKRYCYSCSCTCGGDTLEETGKTGKLIVLIYTTFVLDLPHSGLERLKQEGERRGARKPQTTNVQPVIFQSRKSLLE